MSHTMSSTIALLVACAVAHPLRAQAPALNSSDPAVTLLLSATEVPTNGTVKIWGWPIRNPGCRCTSP